MGTETYVNIYSPIYEEWEMTGKRRERRIGIEKGKNNKEQKVRENIICVESMYFCLHHMYEIW